MKHVIVYAHPHKKSFNHSILKEYAEAIQQRGHEVMVRDLYQLQFDPVLTGSDLVAFQTGVAAHDILREQQYISWADVVTFIYPIWWTGMPAIMKGYIDRVFSYGFAYQYVEGIQRGLMKGKQAVILNTQGKSNHEYDANGMTRALQLTSDKGIFEYCGFEVNHHIFFGSVPGSSETVRQGWLQEIRQLAALL